MYADADALFAVPLNRRFEPVGDSCSRAAVESTITSRHSNVALSDNGTVVYLPAEHVREAELVVVGPRGERHSRAWRTRAVAPLPCRPMAERQRASSSTERSCRSGSSTWSAAQGGCSSPKARAASRSGAGTVRSSRTCRTVAMSRLFFGSVPTGPARRSS